MFRTFSTSEQATTSEDTSDTPRSETIISAIEEANMTREEENKRMIEANALVNKPCTPEEGHLLLLGTINAALFDISKSLAVIADSMRKGGR